MIPVTEIAEMMLMMFCFFFENKYRSAMNSGRFKFFYEKNVDWTFLFLKQIVDMLNIIEAVVDVKLQFGDDTHHLANPPSQFSADRTAV